MYVHDDVQLDPEDLEVVVVVVVVAVVVVVVVTNTTQLRVLN